MKKLFTLNTVLTFLIMLLLLTGCKKTTETITSPDQTTDKASGLVLKGTEEPIDHLPSWNDTKTKQNIIAYVNEVTDKTNANFIPVEDRIAVFDNDGTLWSEQPAYFHMFFAIDRVKAMAPEHPEWKNKQPYKAVLENDMKALMDSGEKGIGQLLMTALAGMSTVEFETIVKDWIKTAKHPTKNVGYDQLVYQPMLELLNYLRANNFKMYIVSGGGIEFMRAIVSDVYGIPSEQIIGSSLKTKFVYNDGKPVIMRLPELDFYDDKEGKPLAINHFIGKKPVFAGGNSDGDLQMLQWTASNTKKSFMLYVHHTDEAREWAYDRESSIGKLNLGLDQAIKDGWTVADMKNDWKVIYPFELDKK